MHGFKESILSRHQGGSLEKVDQVVVQKEQVFFFFDKDSDISHTKPTRGRKLKTSSVKKAKNG